MRLEVKWIARLVPGWAINWLIACLIDWFDDEQCLVDTLIHVAGWVRVRVSVYRNTFRRTVLSNLINQSSSYRLFTCNGRASFWLLIPGEGPAILRTCFRRRSNGNPWNARLPITHTNRTRRSCCCCGADWVTLLPEWFTTRDWMTACLFGRWRSVVAVIHRPLNSIKTSYE